MDVLPLLTNLGETAALLVVLLVLYRRSSSETLGSIMANHERTLVALMNAHKQDRAGYQGSLEMLVRHEAEEREADREAHRQSWRELRDALAQNGSLHS